MTPLIEDPSLLIKLLMSVGGAIVLILFTSACSTGMVARDGGIMAGNDQFWQSYNERIREINRPGQVEVLEELKLRIRQPRKPKTNGGS